MHDREYGRVACIGLAVPQANPTAEPEIIAFVPEGVNVITTRLSGSRSDSRDRLVGYLDNLVATLEAFDTAELDAVAYACTGSSYIVGEEGHKRVLEAASERFGYPIISATTAIEQALRHMGAERIAVFSPYPVWLAELGIAFWRNRGFDVVDHATAPLDPSDTRSIYKYKSDAIAAYVTKFSSDVDAILISGTGMPTLRAIGSLMEQTGKPLVSSTLCLAWASLRAAGAEAHLPPPAPGEPLMGGWAGRLRA